MAAITTVDGLLARISNEYDATVFIYSDEQAGHSTSANTASITINRGGYTQSVPNPLPTGVTSYIPSCWFATGVGAGLTQQLLFAELIDLGHLDISGPTFTDGSSMPTRTELGASNVVPGGLLIEVTTVLNATPGTYTVTYVDQDGNSAETTGAMTPSASATVGSAAMATLNGNDWGVRDVTAATRSGGTTPTGVLQFYGLIPIGCMPCSNPGMVEDLINSGMIRRLGAGAKLGVFHFGINLLTVSGWTRFVGDS